MKHKYASQKVSCSVVGARGYAGLETARLLLQHPRASLTHCFATSEFRLTQYLNSNGAAAALCLPDSQLMQNLTDVVFLATPAEVSLELAPKILAAGKKVIDLSGAFRLKANDYKYWYGFEHTEKALLQNAEYGLAPWAGPAHKSHLIANPGCFATAISLALIPLVKSGLIDTQSIVIDAKSGTSGAGKKAAENLLFTEVDGECLPYKVGKHQHYPEIVEAVESFAGQKIDAHFSTSLLPVRRGIIASVFCRLNNGNTITDVQSAFASAYGEYPLVVHAPVKEKQTLLSLKKVVGTAYTHISYEVVGSKLYVFSCIDNLMKGAASQAIENFNRLIDQPVETAISHMEALI